jgi:hypothetical protein
MPRPRDRAITEEHRENIRRAQMERWRRLKAFTPVREAIEAGDERLAVRLVREMVRGRKAA